MIMTRAEVIEALQRHAKGEGPRVERVLVSGGFGECMYHSIAGPQRIDPGESWKDDAIMAPEFYRLARERRRPVPGFVEVDTFEEAQRMSAGDRERLAWFVNINEAGPCTRPISANTYWLAIDKDAK